MFQWHKKEKPFLGLAGMGGGVVSRLVGGGINYISSSITVVKFGDNTNINYTFPSQWQNAQSLTTVVFGGSGKGGNGSNGAFLDAGGGGGSGAVNFNKPAPLSLDYVQNGLTFQFNQTNSPSQAAPTNRVTRSNDSGLIFELANGYNGVVTAGGNGGQAANSSPGSLSGVAGGHGGGRDAGGSNGSPGTGVAGAGGGGFGRGNNQSAGNGAAGGSTSSPYPSYPQWTINPGGSALVGPGSSSGEYGGSGGNGWYITASVPGAPIPAPNNYFGAGGGGGGASQLSGRAGQPGFFVVYIEGMVPEV